MFQTFMESFHLKEAADEDEDDEGVSSAPSAPLENRAGLRCHRAPVLGTRLGSRLTRDNSAHTDTNHTQNGGVRWKRSGRGAEAHGDAQRAAESARLRSDAAPAAPAPVRAARAAAARGTLRRGRSAQGLRLQV
ncbi:hypothetical protein Q5P01_005897 [Channa striata]|uniref:Uncharacterized protein n=1 Tax=Channa striata TaxID=64152 RepID=A0AA88NES6_CHASR|nr:hypothetical protein Q5P01_005897 [Channa striata]